MNQHYPIPISSDTGALTVEGNQILGGAVGATAGLVIGKGKLLPIAIGAGLGYLIAHTTFFQKLTGS